MTSQMTARSLLSLTAMNLLTVAACTLVLSSDEVDAKANKPVQQIADSSTHPPSPREIYLDDNCQPTKRREMTW